MKLVSINVGAIREVPWKGTFVTTGIFKSPVAGPVRLRPLNLDGDGQADPGIMAARTEPSIFTRRSITILEDRIEQADLPWGSFGENFTTLGLSEADVQIGDHIRVGSVVLMATQPRLPCYKLGIRFGDSEIIKRFMDTERLAAAIRQWLKKERSRREMKLRSSRAPGIRCRSSSCGESTSRQFPRRNCAACLASPRYRAIGAINSKNVLQVTKSQPRQNHNLVELSLKKYIIAIEPALSGRPHFRIRTCGTTAYGSYSGCKRSNRTPGYGCKTLGDGSQCRLKDANFSHVSLRPRLRPDTPQDTVPDSLQGRAKLLEPVRVLWDRMVLAPSPVSSENSIRVGNLPWNLAVRAARARLFRKKQSNRREIRFDFRCRRFRG